METLKNKILLLRKEKIDYNVIVLTLLCACFNPFLTFLVGSIVVLSINPYKYELRLWGWIGVFFVSLLSMTKVPESDLGWVVDHFHQAGKMSYISYLSLLGKEPLYQSFSYIMHYVLANNEKLFVFSLSMISMSLLYISLYTFCEKVKVNKYVFITCVYIMLFFPFFFGMPVHVVRQTMAMSVFVFVLVNKICGKKFYWPLALCAPFIHSTAFLCLPFLFLGYLKKPINMKTLMVYCLVGVTFFSIQTIASFLLSSLFVSDSSISYALGRASRNTVVEARVVGYQLIMTYMIGQTLLITMFNHRSKKKDFYVLNYFSNFIVLIIIFVFSATGQDELQMRFNFLIWQFLPIIICVLFKLYKVDINILQFLCFLLLLVWFQYEYFYSPFTYKGLDTIWINTVYSYYTI